MEENDKPKTLWASTAGQSLIAPPIVFGDTLLLATEPANREGQVSSLQAFDLSDGSQRWGHDFEYASVTGMQAYYLAPRQQELVVVSTSSNDFLRGEGSLLALDQEGQVIWRSGWPEDRFSAPVVMDRKVYVLAGSSTLLIVSPEVEGDDETHISLDANISIEAPVIHDGVVYIPCRGPELLAVELNGKPLWHFRVQLDHRDWLDTTPAVCGDRLYAVSSGGTLFALERKTGDLVWQISLGDESSLSRPVVDEEHLFVGHRRGLYALEANNGRQLWRLKTQRPVSAVPLVHHNTVYVACHDHYLYALDKTTKELKWRHNMSRRMEEAPVLSPSALLIVDRGGQIAALERPPEPEVTHKPERDLEAIKAAAEKSEQQGNSLQAAELWCQLGDLERAAELFESGGAWLQAAETWQKLLRYKRRAEAYQEHAQIVSDQIVDDEEKAAAWDLAARAYRETMLREARLRAQKEAARYRRHPILEVKIEHQHLKVESWASITYLVRNEGFGPARLMGVSVNPGRFEIERTSSFIQPVLHPGSDPHQSSLQVRPLQKGAGVPMKLIVEYQDLDRQKYRFDRTFNVPVYDDVEEVTVLAPSSFDDLTWIPKEERSRSLSLAREISQRFNTGELVQLADALGIDLEDLGGKGKASKARELVKYYQRREKIDELIETGRKLRPDIDWDQFV
jgi:outer membrane protein assembly factor BamB